MSDPLLDYLSENYSYFTDEEWNETPAERDARMKRPVGGELPKGNCPKCGKHIGKGVHFHMKACDA